MPKTIIDYSNTIFYKITCIDPTITDVYVGHTTNFVQRKHAHKQSCINIKTTNYKCKLYQVIRNNGGWKNWNMEIINFHNCSDHYEARKKEQEYFISLKATLNSIEPMPKPKLKLNPNPVVKELIIKENESDEIKEDMITIGELNKFSNFKCEYCQYVCCKNSEYIKHLLTRKHIDNASGNKQISEGNYYCDKCNKLYKSRKGLWGHNKVCINEIVKNEHDSIILSNNSDTEVKSLTTLIMELIEINKDLQNKMLEVCKKSNIKIL